MRAALAASLVLLAALAWAGAGAARADTFTDAELAGRAADAYLDGALATAGSLDDADHRELARIDDAASGVQAIALERRRDHAVVVAFGGTSAGEPVDLLADLGLAAREVRYLVTDAAIGIVADAERRGALPARRAAAARRAVLGRFPPPRMDARSLRAVKAAAARIRARGPSVTDATEAQLAVSRRFLEQVLAMKDLAGRPIVVGAVVITGHSLGGFIAQIVAAERGARAVTFNAPGAQHYAPALRGPTVRNLIRRHDVVGTFGVHLGATEVWDDVPLEPAPGESKLYVVRNHSIAAFHATLAQAGG